MTAKLKWNNNVAVSTCLSDYEAIIQLYESGRIVVSLAPPDTLKSIVLFTPGVFSLISYNLINCSRIQKCFVGLLGGGK